jgi:hypothetical protein
MYFGTDCTTILVTVYSARRWNNSVMGRTYNEQNHQVNLETLSLRLVIAPITQLKVSGESKQLLTSTLSSKNTKSCWNNPSAARSYWNTGIIKLFIFWDTRMCVCYYRTILLYLGVIEVGWLCMRTEFWESCDDRDDDRTDGHVRCVRCMRGQLQRNHQRYFISCFTYDCFTLLLYCVSILKWKSIQATYLVT